MGTLFLIRHGQASYGQADYDRLSPRGIAQARALATWLASQPPLDHVYVGPHVRQRQTAEHAGLLARATELLELAEYPGFELVQHFVPRLVAEDPEFAQLTSAPTPRLLDRAFHTVLRKWSEDAWQAPEVERVAAFVGRVRAALERAIGAATQPGARIAMVTSAGVIGAAVGQTFALPPPRAITTSIVIRNASISELRFRSREPFTWQPEQLSLVTFNSTGHLPADLQTER